MDRDLILKALLGLLATPLFFGVPIFLSAGTVDYWQGWAFIGVFSVATLLLTLYLIKHDPALLRRRIHSGPSAETRPAQRLIMVFVWICFFLLLVVSGLDHRFGWSPSSPIVSIIGDFLIAMSYVMFFFVMRENSFASATIELAEGQQVISSGPYHYVRHPMYAGAILLMVGMPLALGSLWGLVITLVTLPLLHFRIVDEEKFLASNLKGYPEYCNQVRYRLFPGINY